jgi:hypothetical protein
MAMRTGWLAVLALAAATRSSTLHLADPRPAPFHERLHAAHFPRAPGWRTRISATSRERPPCLRQRLSWASDGAVRRQPELAGVLWPAWL